MTKKQIMKDNRLDAHYGSIFGDISKIIDIAKGSAARSVNCIMTAAYWVIGRRILEFEQRGAERADYGEELLKKLSHDLTLRYGRGFAKSNLYQMRSFYMSYLDIFQTSSGKSDSVDQLSDLQNFHTLSGETGSVEKKQTASAEFDPVILAACYPFAMVRLCPAAFGQEQTCPEVL